MINILRLFTPHPPAQKSDLYFGAIWPPNKHPPRITIEFGGISGGTEAVF